MTRRRRKHREGGEELPLFDDYPLHQEREVDARGDVEPPPAASPATSEPQVEHAAESSGADDTAPDNLKLFPTLQAAADDDEPDIPRQRGESHEPEAAGYEGSPEPRRSAPLGDRFLAGLADLAVQVAVLGGTITAVLLMGVPLTLDDWPPFAVLILVFSFLYWVIPLAFWGQTAGMTWIGLLAQSEDGEPLSFGQTAMRWIGALITLALAGLPLLLALTGSSWSDRLSASRTLLL